ncbi:MAG: GAF domain-containing protein [Bacteroidales bacterium]|nr:GAF domain-containing protein [Bacteroidales bacterium]
MIYKLSELNKKINKAPGLDNINRIIFDFLSSLMDISNIGIGIYNIEEICIDFHQFIENKKIIPKQSFSLSDPGSCAVYCYTNQKNIYSNNFENDYTKYISELPTSGRAIPKSVIFIPLTFNNKHIGIFTIQSEKANAYSITDYTFIETIASIIALVFYNLINKREIDLNVIENKKLKAKLEKKTDELKLNKQIIEEQDNKINMLREESQDKGDYLNEVNEILKQRQEQIEEQAEKLNAQKEELEDINDHLKETNTLIQERQKQIEKQAEELNTMNISLRKLNATKDKFFSIIAHDLKNPFHAIMGFTELLLNHFDDFTNEKKINYLQIIQSSAENVFKLLENLLHWARSQTGNIEFSPEVFDLNEMADQNIELVSSLLRDKGITAVKDIPENTTIYADKNMINTVLRNLISNAIKFTEGGKISVIAETNTSQTTIKIIDTGLGIPSDKIDMLFEVDKGKSTEGTRHESGTGLGLILCKEFVEKNAGKIWAESEEGEGSTFAFTVPSKIPQ